VTRDVSLFYKFFQVLFHVYFCIFYRWQIEGLENIPSKGSFLVCANHTSWFDPPLLGAMLFKKRRIYFMAKEELFQVFILGKIVKLLGAFPVKRNKADRRSLKRALQLLERGEIVGLFPEGTRIKTGELGKPFHGPAMIALKSGKPVLPVAIKWPSQRFQKVKVKVGPLIYFQEEGKIKRKALEENSSRIMQAIKSIIATF
jgi:1-acyl-sn-glycerol-3-phosphate acyltransferase